MGARRAVRQTLWTMTNRIALAALLASALACSPVRAADEDLERSALELLARNRKVALEGNQRFEYTSPDAEKYPFQWLWDTCFHTTALRWSDPAFAKGEIESLLAAQWDNGMVPNLVHMNGNGLGMKIARLMQRAGRNTSGITQPPIIAETLLRIDEKSPDLAFLGRVYPKVVKYHEWMARERDPENEGLPIIYHPWESGVDDSPRWDPLLGIQDFSRWRYNLRKFKMLVQFSRADFDGRKMPEDAEYVVRGIDMACYQHVNLLALAQVATKLGKAADAAEWTRRAEATKKAILGRMYNPAIGMFADLLGREAKLSGVPTPFGLLPLYAGIVDQATAERLAATLDDPKLFGTPYPVPSVATSWPKFDPQAYWRGTSWINVNWFLVQGLRRYGLNAQADRLSDRTLAVVRKGGFREYFNPLTGEGYGAANFSWTAAIVVDLIRTRRP